MWIIIWCTEPISFSRRWRRIQKQEQQLLWEGDQKEQNRYTITQNRYLSHFLFFLPFSLTFRQNVYNPSFSCAEKFSRNTEQVRRGRVSLDHPRIIDVHNYRYATSVTLLFHQEKKILLWWVQFLMSASLTLWAAFLLLRGMWLEDPHRVIWV